MNFLRLLVALVISSIFVTTSAFFSPALLASERVGDFSLLDHNGYFHSMSWYDDVSVIALLVQSNGSSTDPQAVPEYQRLKQRLSGENVEFFMINPMGLKDRDEVRERMSAFGSDIPVLMDDAQLIAEALNITVTGEVLLYDPRSFHVIFRGPIGGELESAMRAISAGNSPGVTQVSAAGDPVVYAARSAHQAEVPSYDRDIAPIIAEHCAKCHREGGIAPFAMDSHTMVQGWSPMIREVVMTKRMPPGQIDPHVGDFSNSMVLPDHQAQQLLHWIAAGAPMNAAGPDPLLALEWPDSRWAFGEPDYVIKIPPQEIPATGVLDYYNVVVPITIASDRWVRASQYIPGDRTVLHHTLHSIIPPGAQRGGSLLGGDDPDRPDIAPYIPGQDPRMEPADTGGLLKAGTTIAMQMHYTTTGRATVDESEIGVWFYPEDVVPKQRMSGACACVFTPTWTHIPPHDPDFEMSAFITIDQDAELFSLTPHMHFRGKRMRFTATYPDGQREELINIANYNYNWQLAYTFSQPKFIPAGTIITADGAFDNSTRNKNNPDPDRSVPWGLQSWDEMFFGAADWKVLNQVGATQ
ncbi:MAG: hypothetical protein Q8S94_12090 [Pseudohongiella sp.]|nr:hypothetical protein [Pseudohongiella sp.]